MICNKAFYETRAEAKAQIRSGKMRGKQLFAYPCSDCGFWHLTSMSRKTAKRVAKIKKRKGL